MNNILENEYMKNILETYSSINNKIKEYENFLEKYNGDINNFKKYDPEINKDFLTNILSSYSEIISKINDIISTEEYKSFYDLYDFIKENYEGGYFGNGVNLLIENDIKVRDDTNGYNYNYNIIEILVGNMYSGGIIIKYYGEDEKPYYYEEFKNIEDIDLNKLKQFINIIEENEIFLDYIYFFEHFPLQWRSINEILEEIKEDVKEIYLKKLNSLLGNIDIKKINKRKKYIIIDSINYADEFDYTIGAICSGEELLELINITEKEYKEYEKYFGTNESLIITTDEINKTLKQAIEVTGTKELEKFEKLFNKMAYINIFDIIY